MSGAAQADFPIGRRVALVLASKREVTGTIFAFDVDTNLVVLEETQARYGDPGLQDTILVNVNSIVSKVFLSEEVAPAEVLFSLSKDLAAKREKTKFQQREKALLTAPSSKSNPPAASARAQELFVALSKTYECRWKQPLMLIEIVPLGVSIKPPYNHNDVSGLDQRAVIRVKELVQKIVQTKS
jgi:small nuclear ribonucleoprotein (snRNP)-like protein